MNDEELIIYLASSEKLISLHRTRNIFGETNSHGHPLANLVEQVLRRDVTQVMSYLKVTMRSSALRMDLIYN